MDFVPGVEHEAHDENKNTFLHGAPAFTDPPWASTVSVAALFVSLHVASDAEELAAALVLALVGLLASVGVGVYFQRAGSGEGLVACRTDIAVLVRRVGV